MHEDVVGVLEHRAQPERVLSVDLLVVLEKARRDIYFYCCATRWGEDRTIKFLLYIRFYERALAAAHGVRKPHRGDTLDDILNAPERDALIDWLRQRPLALFEHGWLMVHAGVLPQWDLADTMARAHELVEELPRRVSTRLAEGSVIST